MKLDNGKYECVVCGSEFDLPADERPVTMVIGRVLLVDGEVHRCEMVPNPFPPTR